MIMNSEDIDNFQKAISDLITFYNYYKKIESKWQKRVEDDGIEFTESQLAIISKMDTIFTQSIGTLIDLSGYPVTNISTN